MAQNREFPPIFVVSGGVGASGEQIVRTVLAQFPDADFNLVIKGNVRQTHQIDEIVRLAKEQNALLVHTMVEPELRGYLVRKGEEHQIQCIDLMGDLITWIQNTSGMKILGQPGLYRHLHRDYFERVSAIEYSMAHDDGKHPDGWPEAEIFIIGVSRVGKTPLSLYLSVLGWKVANLPVVPGIQLPPGLAAVDRRRVFALTIEPGQLLMHRRMRQSRLGAPGISEYSDPKSVFEETKSAEEIFRQHGFTIIDVTDKPIESTADEIIRRITSRF